MVLVAGFMTMDIIIILSFSVYLANEHDWMRFKHLLLINLPKYSLFLALPMLLSSWINNRSAKNKNKDDQ